MGRQAHYIPGDNWVECDRCNFTYRRSEIKKEWTGLAVCKPCLDYRHPQDFVRGGPENTRAPDPVRPPKDNIQIPGYAAEGYWEIGYDG